GAVRRRPAAGGGRLAAGPPARTIPARRGRPGRRGPGGGLGPRPAGRNPLPPARGLRRGAGHRRGRVDAVRTDTPGGVGRAGGRGGEAAVGGDPDEWEELVWAALLGTDRRPVPAGGGPAGPGTAEEVLARAAVHTVRRRAGR